jgi:hypothetical protein
MALANSGMSVDSAGNIKKGIDWSVSGETRVEGLSQSRTVESNAHDSLERLISPRLVRSIA